MPGSDIGTAAGIRKGRGIWPVPLTLRILPAAGDRRARCAAFRKSCVNQSYFVQNGTGRRTENGEFQPKTGIGGGPAAKKSALDRPVCLVADRTADPDRS